MLVLNTSIITLIRQQIAGVGCNCEVNNMQAVVQGA